MGGLEKIEMEFSGLKKPDQFTNYEHCEECFEHNETLRKHDRNSITLKQLGNPGWDPVCFIEDPVAFQYYLPALARLASGTGDEYYLDQFLFHLNQERIGDLSTFGRLALVEFLTELLESMAEEIEDNLDTDNLLNKIEELNAGLVREE